MSKPRSTFKADLPKEGAYQAICKHVVELGTQKSNNPKFKDANRILFLYEIPSLQRKGEDGKKYPSYRTIDMGYSPKAKNLAAWMEDWLDVTDISKYDFADAVGERATITIKHSDNGKYANIKKIAPGKGKSGGNGLMEEISVFLDDTFDEDAFNALPQWIQSKIIDSPEYDEVSTPRKKKPAKEGRAEKRAARKKARGK